ncbi:hypothetical protein C8R44DRAFT_726217 [Mycena epipterygia]|nr:hypothetical protein C8R44DRAFT_726217 [Mycena epipterygia]
MRLKGLPSPNDRPSAERCFRPTIISFAATILEAEDLSPAWQAVGKHIHFTSEIQEIAASYTRRILTVEPHEPIPPYIAVHVRQGDFGIWCNIGGVTVEQCFAPLDAFVRRVEEVREEIANRTGITSDEESSVWWNSMYELGWFSPDHSNTVEHHGPWYPIFLDAAIQAGAAGFVGTDTSTVSIISRRRVVANGGVTAMVKQLNRHGTENENESEALQRLFKVINPSWGLEIESIVMIIKRLFRKPSQQDFPCVTKSLQLPRGMVFDNLEIAGSGMDGMLKEHGNFSQRQLPLMSTEFTVQRMPESQAGFRLGVWGKALGPIPVSEDQSHWSMHPPPVKRGPRASASLSLPKSC